MADDDQPDHENPSETDKHIKLDRAASALSNHRTQLYFDVAETCWPLIYCSEYNISFWGMEKVHPFDAGKWGRVYEFLKEAGMIRDDTTVRPREASADDLMIVHPKRYLDSLKLATIVDGIITEWSITVAGITEVPPVALLPNFLVQRKVLRPFRYQTGGSILAGKLALERGWAVNIGGGFHHCSANHGGGFCAYADITLAIKFAFEYCGISKAMIIDLDAHQGNGHERDFMTDDRVYILDIYNRGIYPHDGYAKRGITRKVELQHFTEDSQYLELVRRHVEGALNEFTPDLVVYNAGTDILDGDPLGMLSISAQGIIERDQIVFQKVRTRSIPIMMVTSGGYQRSTARIIADSLLNLRAVDLISSEAAENAPLVDPGPLSSKALLKSRSDGEGWFSKLRRNCATSTRSSTQEDFDDPTELNEGAETGMPRAVSEDLGRRNRKDTEID
ncbi:histone deacetylase 11-like isoform X1 [Lingula anatina]|uniref:Histone deacetylase 11 n=1 Tax=Lingula anatina TaxID=7574 RepID=A0A1S3JBR4_LINAN|nr:histone deacetylase 11-like isoform X1 [Lingula anatina]XP_013407763.1 histone deacetylase 11-like isoform X1 [Lingula anatina]|eukprot:XP_013407762.1 histone deacetylase 11-like isoform X1 [Lingula anatina]